jgi:hypothetical protein
MDEGSTVTEEMEVSGQLHAFAALPLGKKPREHVGNGGEWAPELV